VNAQHRAPHQRVQLKRVYTDARNNFYDTPVAQDDCVCDHDGDHTVVVERQPFEPPSPSSG
jgi:hypothetical protein